MIHGRLPRGGVVDTRTVCACCSSCTCAVRIDHQWTCATYFGSSKTSASSACLLAFIDTSVYYVFNLYACMSIGLYVCMYIFEYVHIYICYHTSGAYLLTILQAVGYTCSPSRLQRMLHHDPNMFLLLWNSLFFCPEPCFPRKRLLLQPEASSS